MTTPVPHTAHRGLVLARVVDLVAMAAAGGIGGALAVLAVGGSPLVIVPGAIGGILVGSLVGRRRSRPRRR